MCDLIARRFLTNESRRGEEKKRGAGSVSALAAGFGMYVCIAPGNVCMSRRRIGELRRRRRGVCFLAGEEGS